MVTSRKRPIMPPSAPPEARVGPPMRHNGGTRDPCVADEEPAMLKEFKEFAIRGNVVDMAVGIIIGAAFGRIVESLVKDIIMPPIGLLLGKVDFSNLFVVLKPGA